MKTARHLKYVWHIIILGVSLVWTVQMVAWAEEESVKESLPNGSFEWIEHLDKTWVEKNKDKFVVSGNDPILPVTWNLDKPGKFAVEAASDSIRSGKYSFTIMPAPLVPGAPWRETQISCGWIEVEREATYTLSGFVKGKGNFQMYIDVQVPEGIKGWEKFINIQLTDSWQEVSFPSAKFPGNISRIRILICLMAPKESEENFFATLDDFSLKTTGNITGSLPGLSVAPQKDEQTTFLDHYDGTILPGGLLTQPVNFIDGRFGKAVYLGAGGRIEYPNDKIVDPKTGTIEFWLKPNPFGYKSYNIELVNCRTATGLFWTYNYGGPDNRYDVFSVSWATQYKRDSEIRTMCGKEGKMEDPIQWNLLDRSSDREWHHVALSWSQSTMRLYVDGLLVGIDESGKPAESAGPMISIGGADENLKDKNPNIGIDELRISRTMRYGTVPAPATPVIPRVP